MVASQHASPSQSAPHSDADHLAAAEAERVRSLRTEPEHLTPAQSHFLVRELLQTDRTVTQIADAWGFTYDRLSRALDLPHIRRQLDAAHHIAEFRASLTGLIVRADAIRSLSRIAELPLPDTTAPDFDERHLRTRAELLRRANTTLLRESRLAAHKKSHPAPSQHAPIDASVAAQSAQAPGAQPPSSSRVSAHQPHSTDAPAPLPPDLTTTLATPVECIVPMTRNHMAQPDASAAAELASKAGAAPTSTPLHPPLGNPLGQHEGPPEHAFAPVPSLIPAYPADTIPATRTPTRTPSLVPD